MSDLGWAILLVGLALTFIAAQTERREKLRMARQDRNALEPRKRALRLLE